MRLQLELSYGIRSGDIHPNVMTASAVAAAGGLTISTVLSSAAFKAAAVGAAVEAAAVVAANGLSGAGLTDGVTAPYLGAWLALRMLQKRNYLTQESQ